MRKVLTLLVCLLAIASVFISCAAEQSGDMATVRISVDNERSRSIAPDDSTITVNDVKKYRFNFMKGSAVEYSFDKDKDSGTYEMTGIEPDTYKLYAEALNEDGKTVATCTVDSINLRRGNNTFSISFTSLNTTATGNVTVSVKYNPDEFNPDSVTISGYLEKVNGSRIELTGFQESSSENLRIATIDKNGLSIGSYKLCIEGKVGTKTMFGVTEVVIVAPEKTTTVFHDFSSSSAVTAIKITDTLVTPLTGTLTLNTTDVKRDITMTLTLQGELPESVYKDAEGNAKKIHISWYLEEYKMGDTEITYNPAGTTATIEANAFYGPAIYSALFYLEGSEESLGSVEVIANYDPDKNEFSSVKTLH